MMETLAPKLREGQREGVSGVHGGSVNFEESFVVGLPALGCFGIRELPVEEFPRVRGELEIADAPESVRQGLLGGAGFWAMKGFAGAEAWDMLDGAGVLDGSVERVEAARALDAVWRRRSEVGGSGSCVGVLQEVCLAAEGVQQMVLCGVARTVDVEGRRRVEGCDVLVDRYLMVKALREGKSLDPVSAVRATCDALGSGWMRREAEERGGALSADFAAERKEEELRGYRVVARR